MVMNKEVLVNANAYNAKGSKILTKDA